MPVIWHDSQGVATQMWKGNVSGIYIAPNTGGQLQSLAEVVAVRGKGLEGDRYCNGRGAFSSNSAQGREITLIEIEAFDALQRDLAIHLEPGDARRNLLSAAFY